VRIGVHVDAMAEYLSANRDWKFFSTNTNCYGTDID